MAGTSVSEINIVSAENSSTTPLAASSSFTGQWTDVTDYTSVSVIVSSDVAAAANGLRLQWSTDGVNLDDEQRFSYASFASEQAKVIHSTTRAKFVRVSYTNSFSSQSFFRLQTLLRKGSAQGSIGPAGRDVTSEFDAVMTNSVLVARQVDNPNNLVLPFATADPFLIVDHPPNRSTLSARNISQQTFSQQLDFFGLFGGSRRVLTVYNETDIGNLLIRLGTAANLNDWSVKVKPDCLWEMPLGWGNYSGGIFGIWDAAGAGRAHVLELF